MLDDLTLFHPNTKPVPDTWKLITVLAICVSTVMSIQFKTEEAIAADKKAQAARYPTVRPNCEEWMMSKADNERWRLRMCRKSKK